MSLDLNASLSLLRIVEKSRDYPKFKAIHDEATAQLVLINTDSEVRLVDMARVAKAKAEEASRAKAKADEERVLKDEAMKPRPAVVNLPEPAKPPEVVKVPEPTAAPPPRPIPPTPPIGRPPSPPEVPPPMQRRSDV